MTSEEKQQLKEDRKADRELIKHIHDIRRQIWEEEKDMTWAERSARMEAVVQEGIQKYG
jgi:hypothetical protein